MGVLFYGRLLYFYQDTKEAFQYLEQNLFQIFSLITNKMESKKRTHCLWPPIEPQHHNLTYTLS